MTQSHTPGPWHRNIKPASKYTCVFAGRNTHVAYVATGGLSEDEIEANCNLVTAAPDMLEALKAVKDWMLEEEHLAGKVFGSVPFNYKTTMHKPVVFQKILAAIAKAEGVQS